MIGLAGDSSPSGTDHEVSPTPRTGSYLALRRRPSATVLALGVFRRLRGVLSRARREDPGTRVSAPCWRRARACLRSPDREPPSIQGGEPGQSAYRALFWSPECNRRYPVVPTSRARLWSHWACTRCAGPTVDPRCSKPHDHRQDLFQSQTRGSGDTIRNRCLGNPSIITHGVPGTQCHYPSCRKRFVTPVTVDDSFYNPDWELW